jgi:adenine-specific DNA glycosylase
MHREEGELMTGMFHLPHGSDALFPSCSADFSPSRHLGSFRHTVTHRRITFDLYEAESVPHLRESSAAYQWVHLDRLHEYPHPSYVRKALRVAMDASA